MHHLENSVPSFSMKTPGEGNVSLLSLQRDRMAIKFMLFYTTLYSDFITFSDIEVLKENQHQLKADEKKPLLKCAELRT